MPFQRSPDDTRRLWVMQQANQRAQSDQSVCAETSVEVVTQINPVLDSTKIPEPTPARWVERLGLRRRPQSEVASSPIKPPESRSRVVATIVAGDAETPTIGGLERARQILASARPATWVFTGDTIVQGSGQTAAGRTYSEHFADHLRNKLRRLLDVVVNTGVPKSRCENLLKTLDWRVTRFAPEVVFLMLGVSDAAVGPAGRDRFRGLLHKVVDAFESSPTTLILQTPPTARPDRWTDANDVLAYVDLVREVATQRSVALIDHWSMFEDRLANAESEPDWWSAGGALPNVRGHVELARQLVEVCCAAAENSLTPSKNPE